MIRLMVGREVAAIYPPPEGAPGGVVLSLRNVGCAANGVRGVTFDVRAGEIVGLAGLVGAGRTELARILFGITPADSGEILLDGKPLTIRSPRDAIARDCPLLVAQGIHRRLAALPVEVLTCRTAVSLDGGTATLRHVLTGKAQRLHDVALLTWSTARVPRDDLVAGLRDAGLPLRIVGDALAPRLMLSAVREGQAAAEAL